MEQAAAATAVATTAAAATARQLTEEREKALSDLRAASEEALKAKAEVQEAQVCVWGV